MNNPTQQLKLMTQKLFKAKSGSVHVKILHPKRDWLIGVGIAICILLGITIWNGYIYFSNRDGGSTDIEIEIANPRYQAELVDQALGVFESRSNNFAIISSSASLVPTEAEEDVAAETATSTATSTEQISEEISIEAEEDDLIEQGSDEVLIEPAPETTEEPETILLNE